MAFSPRGHLAISGDTSGHHNREEACSWRLVSRGQGCCSPSLNAQDRNPQQRTVWQNMSIVPRSKRPVLNTSITLVSTLFKIPQDPVSPTSLISLCVPLVLCEPPAVKCFVLSAYINLRGACLFLPQSFYSSSAVLVCPSYLMARCYHPFRRIFSENLEVNAITIYAGH